MFNEVGFYYCETLWWNTMVSILIHNLKGSHNNIVRQLSTIYYFGECTITYSVITDELYVVSQYFVKLLASL